MGVRGRPWGVVGRDGKEWEFEVTDEERVLLGSKGSLGVASDSSTGALDTVLGSMALLEIPTGGSPVKDGIGGCDGGTSSLAFLDNVLGSFPTTWDTITVLSPPIGEQEAASSWGW